MKITLSFDHDGLYMLSSDDIYRLLDLWEGATPKQREILGDCLSFFISSRAEHTLDSLLMEIIGSTFIQDAERAGIVALFGVACGESPFKFSVLRDLLNSIPSFLS